MLWVGLLPAGTCARNADYVRIIGSSGENVMKSVWAQRKALFFGALVLPVAMSTMAFANEPMSPQKMWLSCENGRDYPLHPLAVSREYDLVTGYLLKTGHGRGVHMRLIPMGSGYRYAGPGVWFDGLRGDAVLNWGRPGRSRLPRDARVSIRSLNWPTASDDLICERALWARFFLSNARSPPMARHVASGNRRLRHRDEKSLSCFATR